MNKRIAVLLIILLSIISYFNIFQNEFVWDDHDFILDNPDIRSFSNIPLFFTGDVDGLYRPLRSFHYTFVYSIAGKNEFLYHFNSLFFHMLISILVFFIIYEITNKRSISLIASLIFAAHPIHTGRVTNITAGFDLFGIFFMILSFYLYVKFSKFNKKKYFLFSLLFFIIALFASEEAITLPLLIVLYGFCFNKEMFKNIKNNIIKNYSAFFIAALLYVILRFFALGIRGRMEEYLAGSFYLTMLTMLKAYVYYIHLLIFPINLTLFHDIKIAGSFFNFNVLISFFILVIVLILTLKFYKNRILFFSVFWFFIALIPMSNILSLQVFMAERYLYVPSIGFSLLLSYFLFSIYNIKLKNLEQRKILRYGVVVFIILLLGFYALRTIDRNADFKNNLTLWSKTVKTSPNNSKAHNNLGFTYEHLGEGKKALEEFEIAVKLRPDNFKALTNLGAVYANLKRYNESVFVLEKAIEIRQYDRTYDKLGLVYVEIGDEENAIEQFNEAIKINPRYAKAHNDLGTVYGRIGEFDLALEEFNTAIKIDKDYADAYYNLGILLEFLDEEDEARKNFENALRLESDNELYIKKSGK
ncbi:MAG TPA: tetratricopeptide repeat protein [Candidatus Woesearchaeota archaeon]|jgi:tetratricopeptide (TPR) repeat protein|nr:tetratricopeptide repeat protein [Candidatus Woesearchaeota archaeon]HJN56536.1 tetratricopeptide repeat protein [Candidatus Woesearchaeota archaeon]|tara:strand:- start:23744 stop:25501 length:1758 start_codon:yes stop_codon:yes gene_type:complete